MERVKATGINGCRGAGEAALQDLARSYVSKVLKLIRKLLSLCLDCSLNTI